MLMYSMIWSLFIQLKRRYVSIALSSKLPVGLGTNSYRLSNFLFYILLSICMLCLKSFELCVLFPHRVFLKLTGQLRLKLVLLFKSWLHPFGQPLYLCCLYLSEASALVNSTVQLALFLDLSVLFSIELFLFLQRLSCKPASIRFRFTIKYGLIAIEACVILWHQPHLVHIRSFFAALFSLSCVCDVKESLVVHQLLIRLLLLPVHLVKGQSKGCNMLVEDYCVFVA